MPVHMAHWPVRPNLVALAAYLPALAIALNNLSVRLPAPVARTMPSAMSEAAGVYRSLAGANPDAYLPELAMSLNNLSINPRRRRSPARGNALR